MREIPDDVLPMWDFWRGAGIPLASFPTREALETYTGKGAWLGLGGEATKTTARLLPGQTQLEYLVLDGQATPTAVTDAVARLTRLKRLDIANVRADNLEFLAGLKDLEYLCIAGLPNARDITPIFGCKKLVSLGLGSKIPDLEAFRSDPLPNLEYLGIGGNSESQPARFPTVQPLAELKSLRYLSLVNIRVADKSLSVLAAAPSLRVLEVYRRKAWPKGEIEVLEGSGIRVTSII